MNETKTIDCNEVQRYESSSDDMRTLDSYAARPGYYLQSDYVALMQERDALRDAARECAAELECEIARRYGVPVLHPSDVRRFNRDMQVVNDVRALLGEAT